MADADRVAVVGTPATLEKYVAYLCKMYGFEESLESALTMSPLARAIDLTKRTKARFLGTELFALGFPPERLLSLPSYSFSLLRDEVDALAWLFVSECNRSSHELLRRYLAHQLPQLATSTTERTTSEQWNEFDAVLEQRCADRGTLFDDVAAAVIKAFDEQHEWFHPEGPSGTAMATAQRSTQDEIRRASALLSRVARPSETSPMGDDDAD